MYIAPANIIAGLGALKRQELCDLIAVFEDSSLIKLTADKITDLTERFRDDKIDGAVKAFEERLSATSIKLMDSSEEDSTLRFRLWRNLRSTFGHDAELPFSIRSSAVHTAELAQSTAQFLAKELETESGNKSKGLTKWARKCRSNVVSLFKKGDVPDFSAVIGAYATKMVADAAAKGSLNDKDKALIAEQIKQKIQESPDDLRDETAMKALRAGDHSLLSLFATGGSLVTLSVAVELAGFSAYMLAAKASAIIPLIGGKALVSGLFVLTHPYLIIPVFLGGSYYAGRSLRGSIHERLATSLVVILTLRGLVDKAGGLKICLDDFKHINVKQIQVGNQKEICAYSNSIMMLREAWGENLPVTPGRPPGILSQSPKGNSSDALGNALFPDSPAITAQEALAVAGLTFGDFVYTVASIDPKVIIAADFSRSEDLDGIIQFGAFSERMSRMSGYALQGAESNLRGYIAEQIVAARLIEKGHQVILPETSNNPGYDLIVDGDKFQVKCLSDLSGLAAHFEKYPDLPVIANSELAEILEGHQFEWSDKVFFLEGYDLESAESLMQNAIENASALDDLDIPIFAVTVSAARNLHSWWKGTIPLSDLPFEVAVSGIVKGGLSAAGGFAGKGLGLLIFGPAGAVVFCGMGGVAALFGTNWAKQKFDMLIRPEWDEALGLSVDSFIQALKTAIQKKIEIQRQKLANLSAMIFSDEQRWVYDRLSDDMLFLFEMRISLDKLMSLSGNLERVKMSLKVMKDASVHPWAVRNELGRLLQILESKPTYSKLLKRGYFSGKFYIKNFKNTKFHI